MSSLPVITAAGSILITLSNRISETALHIQSSSAAVWSFSVILSHQRPIPHILWVPYNLWVTQFFSPAAATETFTLQTLGHPLLPSIIHHLRPPVNPAFGGPVCLRVHSCPAAGLSDSPRLDRQWFQTWGTRVQQCVGLSWTSKCVHSNCMMSPCPGLRRWTAASLCQVSLYTQKSR